MSVSRSTFSQTYNEAIIGKSFLEYAGYYQIEKERYYQTFRYLLSMDLEDDAELLEIGGGQLAIMAKKLLGVEAVVGDVSDHYARPVLEAGIPFEVCNLLKDDPPHFSGRFDAILLLEVIEHMPVPGYIVLSKVANWLRPGGAILLTTPNLFRLRNLVRMAFGRDPFDRFMYPMPGQGLGHQLEYSANHLTWQAEQAGLHVERLDYSQLGQTGHSRSARFARRVTSPLRLRKIWRDELVAIIRKA